MKNNTNYPELKPEHSLLLTYTDLEKVAEIDHSYINKMKEVRKLNQITQQNKTGQRAFLHQQRQEEIGPFLQLWRVRVYNSEEAYRHKASQYFIRGIQWVRPQ